MPAQPLQLLRIISGGLLGGLVGLLIDALRPALASRKRQRPS